MSDPEQALTLVSCKDGKMILHEEVAKKVLESVEAKNRPVAIISIAGMFRKGKSFFLNFVLRYLKSKVGGKNTTVGRPNNVLGRRDLPQCPFQPPAPNYHPLSLLPYFPSIPRATPTNLSMASASRWWWLLREIPDGYDLNLVYWRDLTGIQIEMLDFSSILARLQIDLPLKIWLNIAHMNSAMLSRSSLCGWTYVLNQEIYISCEEDRGVRARHTVAVWPSPPQRSHMALLADEGRRERKRVQSLR
ncbi:hypothetical protein B566_EDAN014615, partial [Ephemera danica]